MPILNDNKLSSVPSQSAKQKDTPSNDEKSKRTWPVILIFLFLFCITVVIVLFASYTPNFGPKQNQSTIANKPLQTNSPLLIGAIVPLSGDTAIYGKIIQESGMIAQTEINKQGGIAGRQLNIIWEDGGCNGPTAKAAADKLINQENVEFLFAGTCSDEFLAAAPVAQAKKIISFTSSATSPKISQLGRYVFRTAPSDSVAGNIAAQYTFYTWKARTAAVVTENTEYTLGLRDVFTQEFTSLGGKVVLDKIFTGNTMNFNDIAVAAKSSNADVIYVLPQGPTAGIELLKALKAENVTSRVLTAEVLLAPNVINSNPTLLEGVSGFEQYVNVDNPKAKHFLSVYNELYNTAPTNVAYMLGTYDIFFLIKDSYEKVGGDSDAISNYLYTLTNWNGASGALSFDKQGDPTSSYSVNTVTNGKLKQIDIYKTGGE